MIFLGDIAVPDGCYSRLLDENLNRFHEIFALKDIVINLEGLIIDELETNHLYPILFNHSSVVSVLKKWNTRAVLLANNHTLDAPQYWDFSSGTLNKQSIAFVGAGDSQISASKPVVLSLDVGQIIIYNQCWRVIIHHQENPSLGVYVNEIDEFQLLADIRKKRSEFPDSKICVYFHWNYDLETLPFPAHRRLAMDLIDSGANIVLGTHAHLIQGGERYKHGYIIYGLGNFFVPWHVFSGGRICFPDMSKIELAFEWDPISNSATLHFFRYEYENGVHRLYHLETDTFENSSLMRKYSEYAGMNHKQYLDYFKRHRRKRGMVPIYKDYKDIDGNRLRDFALIRRMRLARLLARAGFRKWNN